MNLTVEVDYGSFPNSNTALRAIAIEAKMRDLLKEAESLDVVVTVERRPLPPLAMGHHYAHVVILPRFVRPPEHQWRDSHTGAIVAPAPERFPK